MHFISSLFVDIFWGIIGCDTIFERIIDALFYEKIIRVLKNIKFYFIVDVSLLRGLFIVSVRVVF